MVGKIMNNENALETRRFGKQMMPLMGNHTINGVLNEEAFIADILPNAIGRFTESYQNKDWDEILDLWGSANVQMDKRLVDELYSSVSGMVSEAYLELSKQIV
jgi:hypothetical protein